MEKASLVLAALLFAFAPAAFCGPSRTVAELVGTPVLNRTGEKLGVVKDVVFDARDGAIVAITVEYGRWLRVASHEAAFAPDEFAFGEGKLAIALSPAALRRAPAIGWPEWPALRASYVIGREVRDRLRRDSGEMTDLVIDLSELRVRYAVIDVRDDWEERPRLLRLPFSSFNFPREFGEFPRLKVRREQLAADGAGASVRR